jgi:hypothetical protein
MKIKHMNTIKQYKSKILLLAFMLMSLLSQVKAQPDDNGGDPPPNDVPLDEYEWFMVALAVAYGVYLVWRFKQKQRLQTSFGGVK